MKKSRRKKAIAIVIIFTLMISSYLIYNIVNILRYRGGNPNQIIYNMAIDSDVGYDVYLKPNDFFTVPYISNDFAYVTSLVEYIKATFKYDFIGTNNVDTVYDYYIKAQIISNYMEDESVNITKPLWTKDFILLDHKQGHSANSKISIDESLNIGIDYYNNLLEVFRSQTNIVLDSRLDITLIVTISGKLPTNKSLNKEHTLTMSIPLGVKVFDVSSSKNYDEHETIYSRKQLKTETSYVYAILYIVALIIVLWVAFYLIRIIVNRDRSKYETEVNRILKDYDDRIVTVSNFVRYEKMEIVDIPNFSELLTLSDEALEPIIYWEKKGTNYKEAWFSIIKDKVLYRYIITYKRHI